jgi:cell wall-associated NlpC family hydrolase
MSSTSKIAALAGTALLLPILFLAAGFAAGFAAVAGALGLSGPTPPSAAAWTDIPTDYLATYQQAALECPGLPWTVLAAIGKIESDHGRSTLPGVHSGANSAGARRPMQFLPATFAAHARPVPAGGADPPTRYDPVDAIHAAARYLCATGARNSTDLPAALYAYNHSHSYVATVLAQAAYTGADPGTETTGTDPGSGAAAPTTAARTAVNYARAQLGLPYVWGGDGPAAGDAGFDCSGLTHAAYPAAGIRLPRTAATQYQAGPLLPPGEPLRPGDLLFFGQPGGRIHHVAISLGGTRMIHAPTFGQPVQAADDYRTLGDYAGASRPTADR